MYDGEGNVGCRECCFDCYGLEVFLDQSSLSLLRRLSAHYCIPKGLNTLNSELN